MQPLSPPVSIGVGPVTPADVLAVARFHARVELAPAAQEAIAATRGVIDALADDAMPHYGISTGFGALATVHITAPRRAALQTSLIRSTRRAAALRWRKRWCGP